MQRKNIIQGNLIGLIIGCAILIALAPDISVAQDRIYSFYSGNSETLIQSADAVISKIHPDMKKIISDKQQDEARESTGIRYVVAREVPMSWAPDETRVEDITIVGVGVTVNKPFPAGPGAEAQAMRQTYDLLTFLMNEDLQFNEVILDKHIPETGAPAGSYAFYRLKNRIQAVAANVSITINFDDTGFKLDRPDLKVLAEAILSGMTGTSAAAGKVEVFPHAGLSPSNKGLIPASDRLPARIVLSGAKAGDEVHFRLAADTPGELRVPGKAGKEVSAAADKTGQAVAQYYYVRLGQPLAKPLKASVTVSFAGQNIPAEVNVGLGLAFERLRAVPGQTYENDTHAFTLTVKSTFHPDLNLGVYLAKAEEAEVWSGVHMGIELYTEWLNRPADAAHDDYYKGTANIVSGGDQGVSFLVANQTPWYSPPGAKFFYPAVVMRSNGRHAYQVNGRGAVLSSDGTFIDFLDEKMVKNETLLFLSKEDPEAWYESLACSLNATTENQYLMLEAVKLVPVYGTIADKATMLSGLVCGLLNEKYEKSFMDLANWLGAQYLDNLMEPEVFDKLTKKQQNAVLAAKGITTGGADNFKRKKDVDALPSTSE